METITDFENKIKEIYKADLCSIMFYDKYINDVEQPEAETINILLIGEDISLNFSVRNPKNFYFDYLINKIENKLNSKSNYKKLFAGLNVDGFYNTTYGVGVFMPSWNEKRITELNARLQNLGIEYKTQYSDARWVYRFVFSKNQSNLDKINQYLR